MKCNTCGRQSHNEEANFCDYCGASFREQAHADINASMKESIPGGPSMAKTMPFPIPGTINQVSEPVNIEKPVSFLNWLATYSLLFIPFFGWLAFIILLCIWAFDGKTPMSKKTWARATLILVGIAVVLLLGYLMFLFSSPMFQDMLNGTFDYSSYYNSLIK